MLPAVDWSDSGSSNAPPAGMPKVRPRIVKTDEDEPTAPMPKVDWSADGSAAAPTAGDDNLPKVAWDTPAVKTSRKSTSGNPTYDSLYDNAAQKYNVDPNLLIEQARAENGFHATGSSPKGAVGIAQFIPDTARTYGLRVAPTVDDRLDPAKSIDAQARMMRDLLGKHGGNVEAALAAYNSGSGLDTARALRNRQHIPETRNYVDKITRALNGAPPARPKVTKTEPLSPEDAAAVSAAQADRTRRLRGVATGELPNAYPTDDASQDLPPVEWADEAPTPVPEAPETLDAQFKSAQDPDSPKAAVLVTPGERPRVIPDGFDTVDTPKGPLYINRTKAPNATAADMDALLGTVEPVSDTSKGVAVVGTDKKGNEVESKIVTSPAAATAQTKVIKAMHPGAKVTIVPAATVAAARILPKAKAGGVDAGDVEYWLGVPAADFANMPPDAQQAALRVAGSLHSVDLDRTKNHQPLQPKPTADQQAEYRANAGFGGDPGRRNPLSGQATPISRIATAAAENPANMLAPRTPQRPVNPTPGLPAPAIQRLTQQAAANPANAVTPEQAATEGRRMAIRNQIRLEDKSPVTQAASLISPASKRSGLEAEVDRRIAEEDAETARQAAIRKGYSQDDIDRISGNADFLMSHQNLSRAGVESADSLTARAANMASGALQLLDYLPATEDGHKARQQVIGWLDKQGLKLEDAQRIAESSKPKTTTENGLKLLTDLGLNLPIQGGLAALVGPEAAFGVPGALEAKGRGKSTLEAGVEGLKQAAVGRLFHQTEGLPMAQRAGTVALASPMIDIAAGQKPNPESAAMNTAFSLLGGRGKADERAPNELVSKADELPPLTPAQLSDRQTQLSKPLTQSDGSNAELGSSISNRNAAAQESLGGLDIPTRREMFTRMVASIHQPEVRQRIVQLIPVNVVDDLAALKPSTKILFHDEPMLLDPAPVRPGPNGQNTVSVNINMADALLGATADVHGATGIGRSIPEHDLSADAARSGDLSAPLMSGLDKSAAAEVGTKVPLVPVDVVKDNKALTTKVTDKGKISIRHGTEPPSDSTVSDVADQTSATSPIVPRKSLKTASRPAPDTELESAPSQPVTDLTPPVKEPTEAGAPIPQFKMPVIHSPDELPAVREAARAHELSVIKDVLKVGDSDAARIFESYNGDGNSRAANEAEAKLTPIEKERVRAYEEQGTGYQFSNKHNVHELAVLDTPEDAASAIVTSAWDLTKDQANETGDHYLYAVGALAKAKELGTTRDQLEGAVRRIVGGGLDNDESVQRHVMQRIQTLAKFNDIDLFNEGPKRLKDVNRDAQVVQRPVDESRALTVKTPHGTEARYEPRVVDRSQIITSTDPQFPQELQTKDIAGNKSSKAQIDEISRNLDPRQLGDDVLAGRGRPLAVEVEVANPDGTKETKYAVVSGNHRVTAIDQAYDTGGSRGEGYEAFAREQDPNSTAKRPVHIGVLDTNGLDLKKFAREANAKDQGDHNAVEQAYIDAENLDSHAMSLFVPSEDGSIHGAANRKFLTKFFGGLTEAEQRNVFQENGEVSNAGLDRVKNALIAKAFGDSRGLVERMISSPDNDIKRITNAMLQSVNSFADFKQAAADGARHTELDITGDITAAVERFADLKKQGRSLKDYDEQPGLADTPLTPLQDHILRTLDTHKNSSKALKTIFDNYLDYAEQAGDPRQEGLMGAVEHPNAHEIFKGAAEYYAESKGKQPKQASLGESKPENDRNSEDVPAKPRPKAGSEPVPEAAGSGTVAGDTVTKAGKLGKVYERQGELRVKYDSDGKTESEALSDDWVKAKNPEAGAVSTDLLTLGLTRTIADDVVPAAKEAAKTVSDSIDDIKKLVLPAERGAGARLGAGAMREALAKSARAFDIATHALKEARQYFKKQPVQDNYAFIGAVEGGDIKSLPAVEQPMALKLRELLDDARKRVQDLGTGKLEDFIENYFPHIWEQPGGAAKFFGRLLGKRPLEGSKNFLKQRTMETFKDGLDAGLKPVSDNPVDLTLLKIREMNRYIAAHEAINEGKDAGYVPFVRVGAKPPEGMIKINDKIGDVRSVNSDGELVIRGSYYADPGFAKIVNNHLSPGLRSRSSAYRAWLTAGNMLNQAQLGISAFHLGFTTMDAMNSKLALAVNELSQGHPIKAAKSAAEVPVSWATNIIRGDRLMRQWDAPDAAVDPVNHAIAELAVKAGARAKLDSFYHTRMAEKMVQAFKRGNIVGGTLRMPGAALDVMSKPLMEYLVPRQKFGVFADMAQNTVERLGPNATPEQIREALGKDWDSVDNRMGQMVYDNLFWNNTIKDLAMGSVRSVGWNYGDIRELGGAVKDTATIHTRIGQKMRGETLTNPIVTRRMAYAAALPVLTGIIGGTMTYLFTGERPKELKDYYFPRTGNLDENGRPERLSLPSYMKDVEPLVGGGYAGARTGYKRDGAGGAITGAIGGTGSAAGTMAIHKLHPLLNLLAETLQNKDFYGTQIRNEDDPYIRQLIDVAKNAGKDTTPFAIQGLMKQRERGGSITKQILPFIGLTPAPASLENTDAEQLAGDLTGEKQSGQPRTKAQAEKSTLKRQLSRELKLGHDVADQIAKAQEAGLLSSRDASDIRSRADHTYLENTVKRLSAPDAIKVYEVANDEEQARLKDLVQGKIGRTQNPLSDADKARAKKLGLDVGDEDVAPTPRPKVKPHTAPAPTARPKTVIPGPPRILPRATQ